MSTKDEKEWLRAVLEGRIKPGDAEWRQIWREEDFVRVRGVLREVGMMERGDTRFDKEKMWQAIEGYRGTGTNRRRAWGGWRWVAAVVLPLLVGGTLWLTSRNEAEILVAPPPVLEAGSHRAVLIMERGERVDLASVAIDTVLEKEGVRIRLDSSRGVTYEPTGELPGKAEYNTIVVPRKAEYRFVLADGTRVYMNSESELRYPTFFTGSERRVTLRGEAYFEVATDAEKPFIVEANAIDVRVLGTRFNVNAYTPDRAIRTTLVSGKVLVSDRGNQETTILSPGQQAVWQDGHLSTRDVDVSLATAWVNGKFYFEEGATLQEIAEQLERWYDITFFFSTERVKHLVFGGMIKKEYTANQIFSIIEKTTGVKFEVNGRVVTVSETNNYKLE